MNSKSIMSANLRADRLRNVQQNVWTEFSELTLKYNPINLGQGFPDFPPPRHLCEALALVSDNVLLNQYTRSTGHPRLMNVLSQLYSKLTNHSIDPKYEILITSGAFEALFCTFMAFVNPGDEVIIVEPYSDCYETVTQMAGGIPVFIPLLPKPVEGRPAVSSADWVLDVNTLKSKFNSKTKIIVVNNPNNPLGKVFSETELKLIGDLCKEFNCIAVVDEVYEWLIYSGSVHKRMCSLPDMWDYTITIGSGGKTFSVTGWKIGWAYGPKHLIEPIHLIHQNNASSSSTPIQEALAVGFEVEFQRLETPDSYWKQLSHSLESKRNRISDLLLSAKIDAILPEAGYFIICDFSKLTDRVDLSLETGSNDYRIAKWLIKNMGLQGIPVSAFYSEEHKHLAQNLIRFCFVKNDETLGKVEQIINDLKRIL